jgi:glycerol uptake facilitator protein
MFLILALTDSKNTGRPGGGMAPFFIGFTIACLMALYAPLTQGGFNPARDFGPRLVACLGGWGSLALPGPNNEWWVYICGPMFGAPWGK